MRVPNIAVAYVMREAMAERLTTGTWTIYGLYWRPRATTRPVMSLVSLDDLIDAVAARLVDAVTAGIAEAAEVAAILDTLVHEAAELRGIDRASLYGVGFIGTATAHAEIRCSARLIRSDGIVHTGTWPIGAPEPDLRTRTGTDARAVLDRDALLAALGRLLAALTAAAE